MSQLDAETDDFLRTSQSEPEPLERTQSEHTWVTKFNLTERTYQQQFSDIYFLRLAKLKLAVEDSARKQWDDLVIAGEEARRVDRVLDVRQGELCWVSGTVYMEMSLKPNIIEDLSKDHWLAVPAAREKYIDSVNDQVFLEDESGRIRLTGTAILGEMLVTGVIIAVLGTENADGEFDVIDVLLPEVPSQPPLASMKPPLTKSRAKSKSTASSKEKKYLALVSGLRITGEQYESLSTHLLTEFLLGELSGPTDQAHSANITRLIIAGNSLADSAPLPVAIVRPQHDANLEGPTALAKQKNKKYGYDASTYSALPTIALDLLLADILPSIAVDLMPGDTDPAGVAMPQQPIHPTMLPLARRYLNSTFHTVTNPYICHIDNVEVLGTSGQTINDIFKYVTDDDRLAMIERTLRWRHIAPTCPDTLWSYPFQNVDPFVLERCPEIYFVGNQPEFRTKLVTGEDGQRCRLVALPNFDETGEVVLVDLESLDVEVVKIGVMGGTVVENGG